MCVCSVIVVAMYLHTILVLKQVSVIMISTNNVFGKMHDWGGGFATPVTTPLDPLLNKDCIWLQGTNSKPPA